MAQRLLFATAQELESIKDKYEKELETRLQSVNSNTNLSIDQIAQKIELRVHTSV